MRQRVRNPKRGEERRGEFALTGTKRKKRKEKRKKGRRKKGRRRGRKAWKLVQWLCVSWAPSSLSNTPSNIPSAITYSLLYTPTPFLHMSRFSITHTSPQIFATYGRAWKHTLTLLSFHSDSFVSLKVFYKFTSNIRDSRLI